MSSWMASVNSACGNDTVHKGGKLVPAGSIAGVFNDGYGIACLQNS